MRQRDKQQDLKDRRKIFSIVNNTGQVWPKETEQQNAINYHNSQPNTDGNEHSNLKILVETTPRICQITYKTSN